MKFHIVLLSILLALGSSNCLAQEKKFTFGPKVGFMFGAPIPHGKIESIDSTKGTPLIGPNIGVFFLYQFAPKWSLWVEGNYNRKALEYSAKATNLYYVEEICFDLSNGTRRCGEVETLFNGTTWGSFDNWYFEIPVLIRYSLNDKWHLFAGPYYASLNKSSSKVFYNGFAGASTIPLQDERDVSDNMNKHDYGVNLGFHYQYKPILVDFRMSYGFTSIFNKEYKPIDYPVRNVYAQLSVAFQFRYKNELDPK